ncbi:hypothetical protein U9M48_000610 [Paspalum notatum var. saurae]|uniref:Uncharacterized protein n=1 Tax=Paspalum notatum var. saurae TaxID=547442 RepID=A0AAQ3PLV4_PASNO
MIDAGSSFPMVPPPLQLPRYSVDARGNAPTSAEVMVATGTFATSFRTKDPRWSCSPRHRLVSALNLASPRTLVWITLETQDASNGT